MINSILLPIDMNHPSSWAKSLPHAISLAKANGARIHVLSVIPDYGSSLVGSYFPADFSRKAAADTKAALDTLIKESIPAELAGEALVRHGAIYKEITTAADRLKADMIVMAAHRPEMKDYFLGPNAARVVRHAKQSVLVVR